MKWLSYACLTLMLVFGLTCCTPATPSAPPTPPTPITLEFWTLQLRDFTPLIRSWIDDYEAVHPQVRIHWVDVPFAEGEKRALTAMLSPHVPDVINLNPAFASTLAERRALLELTPFLKKEVTIYAPALLSYCQFSGSLVALPWYTTTVLSFENTALLKAPAPSGVYERFPLLTSGGNLLKTLALSGDFPTTQAVFHQRLVSILEPVKRGILQKRIPAENITGAYATALELFMAGKLVHLDAGASALKVIENNAPSVYATLRLSPLDASAPARRIDASPMVLVVPKQSQHPKEAVDFARFLTRTMHQLAFSKQAPVLPSTVEGLRVLSQQTPHSLSEEALVRGTNKVLYAHEGIVPRPEQAVLNDLSNAVAQSYLLGDESAFVAYESRLWQKLNLSTRR
jgi:putative chitobiose transport system substrate-binding protein